MGLYIYFRADTHLLTTRAALNLKMSQDVLEGVAVVVVGEDESVRTLEEAGAETETATGIGDDDGQTSERVAVNSGLENEGLPTGLKMTAVGEVEEEGVAGSKSTGGDSYYPATHTQEGATLKGMVEEDH